MTRMTRIRHPAADYLLRPTPTARYARGSGTGAHTNEGNSIEQQFQRIDREFQNRLPRIDAVASYADVNPGTDGKYPGREAMFRAAERGEFEQIATTSFDRLSRSLSEFVDICRRLKDADVGLVVVDQHLDTRAPVGRDIFDLVLEFSRLEETPQEAEADEEESEEEEEDLEDSDDLEECG